MLQTSTVQILFPKVDLLTDLLRNDRMAEFIRRKQEKDSHASTYACNTMMSLHL